MKMKVIGCWPFHAAASAAAAQELPRKVDNVEVLTSTAIRPSCRTGARKNLMIFYVDPDRHKQTTISGRTGGEPPRPERQYFRFRRDEPQDAPMVPNGMARNMAKKRTAKNGALVLADQDRILSKAWELGDCNNQFVLMIVSKEGELVFLRKGVLSEQDKADFYETIEKYK
ncbi:MAG: hypothetical protein ACLU5I_04280 [Alistipes finegoldii]